MKPQRLNAAQRAVELLFLEKEQPISNTAQEDCRETSQERPVNAINHRDVINASRVVIPLMGVAIRSGINSPIERLQDLLTALNNLATSVLKDYQSTKAYEMNNEALIRQICLRCLLSAGEDGGEEILRSDMISGVIELLETARIDTAVQNSDGQLSSKAFFDIPLTVMVGMKLGEFSMCSQKDLQSNCLEIMRITDEGFNRLLNHSVGSHELSEIKSKLFESVCELISSLLKNASENAKRNSLTNEPNQVDPLALAKQKYRTYLNCIIDSVIIGAGARR